MNWLTNLNKDHSLYKVADECLQRVMESYYLIQTEQKEVQDKKED
ncbi:hypothetical protein [Endozoicomonas montiporae]|nr:hypothetical protein [Endozoicomonas montiporae]